MHIKNQCNSKDIITETNRNNDSLKRISKSSKVNESVYRVIAFTTIIDLSFEYIWAAKARGSKKKLCNIKNQLHKLQLSKYNINFYASPAPS